MASQIAHEAGDEPEIGLRLDEVPASDLDPDDPESCFFDEENPIWLQENVTLVSVGIDIGSSGTQVAFSELKLRRDGAGLATRFVVVDRTCLFESVVAFTPFTDYGLIDAAGVGTIIDRAYADAGVTPQSIDTGVVILTGEALRRVNAQNIASVISATAGDFVCAAAGHHMEATLAAFGSGAVQLSQRSKCTLLNVDIGGGTTKLSVIEDGAVRRTAALHIGGRLLATDADGVVTRLEPAGRAYAEAVGCSLRVGDCAAPETLDAIAEAMINSLLQAISPAAPTEETELPYLTEPIGDLSQVDGVVFSGGVAEYVYGLEDQDFGDLGRRLGRGITRRLANGAIPFPLLAGKARIRATVLGASEFCVQLSGTTCFVSDRSRLLPQRNLPVVRPSYQLGDPVDIEAVAAAIDHHVQSSTVPDIEVDVVLALAWNGELSHERLHAFARAIEAGLAKRTAKGHPMLLALEADVGRSLGTILRRELAIPVDILVVDGLRLRDFDYIDIGRPLEPSNAIPVTIKSLVF